MRETEEGTQTSGLTEPGYEGVQEQTDDGHRERHCGYRSPQRSLLLPDLHHHSSAGCGGPDHGFGPKIVPGLGAPLLCSAFLLCHLSVFLPLSFFYLFKESDCKSAPLSHSLTKFIKMSTSCLKVVSNWQIGEEKKKITICSENNQRC